MLLVTLYDTTSTAFFTAKCEFIKKELQKYPIYRGESDSVGRAVTYGPQPAYIARNEGNDSWPYVSVAGHDTEL